jgi:hypothetical protein
MTYPAPNYLEDDPWFGPSSFSLYQKEYKLDYDQAVAENLLLDDSYPERKDIHQVMYNFATDHGKTTIHLNPIGWMSGIS